ncbi:hypothetical protein EDB85DRAFT_1894228 [Lactarius pseudohatsudake]|nr:hypothetical protein EDB85DRAFT_1894228 [Lactarius pseudohatsudake]
MSAHPCLLPWPPLRGTTCLAGCSSQCSICLHAGNQRLSSNVSLATSNVPHHDLISWTHCISSLPPLVASITSLGLYLTNIVGIATNDLISQPALQFQRVKFQTLYMSMLQIGVTSRIMTTAIIKATTTTTTMDDYDEAMAMATAMATGAATTATVTAMVMGRAQGDDDSDYESTSTPQQPQGGDDNSSTTIEMAAIATPIDAVVVGIGWRRGARSSRHRAALWSGGGCISGVARRARWAARRGHGSCWGGNTTTVRSRGKGVTVTVWFVRGDWEGACGDPFLPFAVRATVDACSSPARRGCSTTFGGAGGNGCTGAGIGGAGSGTINGPSSALAFVVQCDAREEVGERVGQERREPRGDVSFLDSDLRTGCHKWEFRKDRTETAANRSTSVRLQNKSRSQPVFPETGRQPVSTGFFVVATGSESNYRVTRVLRSFLMLPPPRHVQACSACKYGATTLTATRRSPLPYDGDTAPWCCNNDTTPLRYDGNSAPLCCDSDAAPLRCDCDTAPLHYDRDMAPLRYDGDSALLCCDSDTAPLRMTATQPRHGPLHYNRNTAPLHYDRDMALLRYDGNTAPLRYDRDMALLRGNINSAPLRYDRDSAPEPCDTDFALQQHGATTPTRRRSNGAAALRHRHSADHEGS